MNVPIPEYIPPAAPKNYTPDRLSNQIQQNHNLEKAQEFERLLDKNTEIRNNDRRINDTILQAKHEENEHQRHHSESLSSIRVLHKKEKIVSHVDDEIAESDEDSPIEDDIKGVIFSSEQQHSHHQGTHQDRQPVQESKDDEHEDTDSKKSISCTVLSLNEDLYGYVSNLNVLPHSVTKQTNKLNFKSDNIDYTDHTDADFVKTEAPHPLKQGVNFDLSVRFSEDGAVHFSEKDFLTNSNSEKTTDSNQFHKTSETAFSHLGSNHKIIDEKHPSYTESVDTKKAVTHPSLNHLITKSYPHHRVKSLTRNDTNGSKFEQITSLKSVRKESKPNQKRDDDMSITQLVDLSISNSGNIDEQNDTLTDDSNQLFDQKSSVPNFPTTVMDHGYIVALPSNFHVFPQKTSATTSLNESLVSQEFEKIIRLVTEMGDKITLRGNSHADINLSPAYLPGAKVNVEILPSIMKVIFYATNISGLPLLVARGGDVANFLSHRYDKNISIEVVEQENEGSHRGIVRASWVVGCDGNIFNTSDDGNNNES